ncbi:MAG: hypothetical protein IH869_03435 [Chloroflexi bacterium]|nr:hypothetical protein [Chloroflexota bacterium]
MAHPTKSQTRDADGLAAEYRALVDGAGLADRSDAGRLRITGADALDLLNRLTTNKLEELPDGHARLTVLTNGDARVIDVLELAAVDGALLCLTSPGRAEAVIDWIDTYTFGEDISIADRTAETTQLTLAGPGAAGVLAAAGVTDAPARERVAQVTIANVGVVLWRTMSGGVEGFEVIVERAGGTAVRAALASAGATLVSAGAWEAFRIANGMPAYGSEFGEATNPLESRLRGAISEDKGCYTGQEVVARLLTYGKVQRRLMSVALSGPAGAGADLSADGARAGTLTSVADIPGVGRVGLALIAQKRAAVGSAFDVSGSSGVTATISEPAYALATEPVEDEA